VRIGDIRVTWLPDGVGRFKATVFLADTTVEGWARYPDAADEEGMLVCSLGGVLVETPDNVLLIDVGVGNHKIEIPIGGAEGGRFFESLSTTGVSPEQVDVIAYTHMHADHVGWTSVAAGDGWTLAFPNARHVLHRDEWAFWEGKNDPSGMPLESMEKPLRDRVELVGGDQSVIPGVTLVHTPGHTPGHSSFVVESQGERVFILGDVLHSPAQISESWVCFADDDPAAARATKEAVMRELQKAGTLTAGTHFPGSIFGRVIPMEPKPRWVMGA
jgi:glyoxylase-like metal-dependent hydrolase (beta-lactamase superfamily II)